MGAVNLPPLPAAALRDLLGVLRVLWWVRWAAGAEESELKSIASAGDDVGRLLRASRFEACVTTWHQARLAMAQVVRLGELVPFADGLLRGGARRVLGVPGIPPPPLHAFAAPTGERPPEDQEKSAEELPKEQPPSAAEHAAEQPSSSAEPPQEQASSSAEPPQEQASCSGTLPGEHPSSAPEDDAPRTMRSREKDLGSPV